MSSRVNFKWILNYEMNAELIPTTGRNDILQPSKLDVLVTFEEETEHNTTLSKMHTCDVERGTRTTHVYGIAYTNASSPLPSLNRNLQNVREITPFSPLKLEMQTKIPKSFKLDKTTRTWILFK